jgi:hypothetical protein
VVGLHWAAMIEGKCPARLWFVAKARSESWFIGMKCPKLLQLVTFFVSTTKISAHHKTGNE